MKNKLVLILIFVVFLLVITQTVSSQNTQNTITGKNGKTFILTQYSDSTYVHFTISPPTQENNKNQKPCKTKFEFDNYKKQPEKTSNWKCINNKLQRTITINGKQKIEYGGLCGVKIPASQKQISYSFIIPIILSMFILITLFLIASITIKSR